MYKHILVPTDGSALAGKALKLGTKLAKRLGAKMTVINVVREQTMTMEDGFAVPAPAVMTKRWEQERYSRSSKMLAAIKSGAKKAGVRCSGVTVTSNAPYAAIIKQARKARCDLIMMASHGRSGLSRLLLGSETSKVLAHSKVPVLVVR